MQGRVILPFRNSGKEPDFDTLIRVELSNKASVKLGQTSCLKIVRHFTICFLTLRRVVKE